MIECSFRFEGEVFDCYKELLYNPPREGDRIMIDGRYGRVTSVEWVFFKMHDKRLEIDTKEEARKSDVCVYITLSNNV